jgi:hypothetical protein
MTTRIYIDGLPRYTNRGARYVVRLQDGPVLLTDAAEPLTDGARALVALGITGSVELWDAERPYPQISGDIERLAGITVKDDRKTSPRFAPWRPFAPDAPRRGDGQPPVREMEDR